MPNAAEVREELTDILVQVVGCAPEDVVDSAVLTDLGVDSLAVVEMADELGRRFDLYLADETVNGLRTVANAVSAVVRHDGTRAARSTSYDPAPPTPLPQSAASPPKRTIDPEERDDAMRRLGMWFVVVGVAVGIVLGLGSAAIVAATGLRESTLPPLTAPTTPAPSPTPTPTQTPEPTEEETVDPDPTLTIASTEVAPGERFTLEGTFPSLGKGETLQVQVKDSGESWDEFPVTTKTRGDGTYRTQIYTSRTGEREFRMAHLDSDATTPAVRVRIG